MDIISILGLTLGLSAIIFGQYLEGGHMSSLLQLTAFIIVIGGTLGAVMLQSSLRVFLEGMSMVKWVFSPPPYDPQATLASILEWSQHARRGGLLALEAFIEDQPELFHRRGLQMLVDGAEPAVLRQTLERDITAYESAKVEASKVWMAAGGYSPTIGIMGAVMGLIHVMENLSDPSMLGTGIAVAFVATLYGVGGANLIYLPIANKLRYIISKQVQEKEMFIEGLIGIANGENPRIIDATLQGYLS